MMTHAHYLSKLFRCLPGDLKYNLESRRMCPYLLYQVFPYCLTLIQGGWFNWVPKNKNTQKREEKYSLLWHDRPNSAFINEVLVRCPNPNVRLIMGAGPSSKDKLYLRVLHVQGHCKMGYQAGDKLWWDKKDLNKDDSFTVRFPQFLSSTFDDTMAIHPCPEKNSLGSRSLQIMSIDTPCRYHHRKRTYSYPKEMANGLCPAAFQACYPKALSYYYDNSYKNIESIICPSGPDNGCHISISRRNTLPDIIHRLYVSGVSILSRFSHPMDPLPYTLSFKIENAGAPFCRHQTGDEFEFNLWNQKVMCPASAYSVYPYFRLSNQGKKSFQASGGWLTAVCPDFIGASYSF